MNTQSNSHKELETTLRQRRHEYYLKNKEKICKQAREYHYKHRDEYNEYSRRYWQDHKDTIMRKRAGTASTRPRANLTKPNKDPVLEDRRLTFQTIQQTPEPEPIVDTKPCLFFVHSEKDFIVSFD